MLEKLGFLIALAREKHFGRAAESCGVAQATLSQGIQQLEEDLNVKLVLRSSRFLGLTPDGERVLIWARRLVGDAHAMRQEILGLKAGAGHHLRLAVMPAAMPIVASVTAPVLLHHPTVHFTLLTRTSDEIATQIDQREIDAGICYIGHQPRPEVEEIPLFREDYVLLTTAHGSFGASDQVTWAQLSGLPLCLLTPNLQQRRIIDSTLQTVGVSVQPMMETDSILALISHVLTGNWVSVLSRLTLEAIEVSRNLRAVPIVEPKVSHLIGLVVSKRFPMQAPMALLMQEARKLHDLPRA